MESHFIHRKRQLHQKSESASGWVGKWVGYWQRNSDLVRIGLTWQFAASCDECWECNVSSMQKQDALNCEKQLEGLVVAIPCRFDSCLGHSKKGLAPYSVPVPFFICFFLSHRQLGAPTLGHSELPHRTSFYQSPPPRPLPESTEVAQFGLNCQRTAIPSIRYATVSLPLFTEILLL